MNRIDFEVCFNYIEYNFLGGVVCVVSKFLLFCWDKEVNCIIYEMFFELSFSVWIYIVCWLMKILLYDGYRFLGDGSFGIENN